MNRRKAIKMIGYPAFVGSALSGCLSLNSGKTIEVTDVDQVPEGIPLSFDIDIKDNSITKNDLGELVISSKNISNSTITPRFGLYAPFTVRTDIQDSGIFLIGIESEIITNKQSCLDNVNPNSLKYVPLALNPVTLSPNENVSRTVGVVGTDENDPCIPTGNYRFEKQYENIFDGTKLTWGFNLRIK